MLSISIQIVYSQNSDSIIIDQNFIKDTIPKSTSKKKSKIDAPIKYNADDSIRFNVKERKVYLYGNAEIKYEKIELKAEYIEFDMAKNNVFASGVEDSTGNVKGKPLFKEGEQEFSCNTLTFNFQSKRGLISGVITEQSGGYLHSDITKRQSNEEIHIKKGKYTTCNLEHPHFYIGLTKAKVIPEDKIVSGPAYLVIEDVILPAGIPFGFFPNKNKNSSGVIIPEYGEELNRGFFLRNGGYYFAVNDYMDLTLLTDIYSRLSWGAALNSNYKLRYKFDGNLHLKYEDIVIGEPGLPNYQSTKTYWIKWMHRQDQKARPYSNFSANVDLGKSSFHKYSAYTDPNSYLRNTTQSNISYSNRIPGTPFSSSINLRHTQNSLDSTVNMSLPEFALNMSRIYPFKSKRRSSSRWYDKIGFSYSSNMRNNITTKDSALFTPAVFDNMKNGIKHSIPVSTSFKTLKYFTLSPSFNYNERWYFNQINRYWDDSYNGIGGVVTDTVNGFVRAYDYSFNTNLNTKLYGMYMFKSGRIKAIRHVLTPTVGYNYRPDFGEDKWNIYRTYQVDSIGTIARYSVVEQGIFGSPPSGKYGMINFSLGNNLEMKKESKKDTTNTAKKIILIESLNFSTSYNIAADSLKLSPLNIQGRTTLFKQMNIQIGATVDPYMLDSLTGKTIDKFMYNEVGKIGRLTSANFTLGFRLNSKSKAENTNSEIANNIIGYPYDYVDFNIPWNFSIDHTFRYSKPQFEKDISQTLRFSGDVNITSKWKISVSTGYDYKIKQFTYTTVNIYRDLHCWEMRFTWIPFGFRQSYNFQINVKAAVLQDLKLTKRSSWSDQF